MLRVRAGGSGSSGPPMREIGPDVYTKAARAAALPWNQRLEQVPRHPPASSIGPPLA